MVDKGDKLFELIDRDSTLVDFDRYHKEPRFENFRQGLRNRKYTVRESDISSRVINYWAEKDLLPEGCDSQNGEWRKFTFIELVWLKVISNLREFGLPLEKISSVKDCVMKWDSKKNCYYAFEYYVAMAKASTFDPYIIIWSDGQAGVMSMTELNIQKTISHEESTLLIPLKSIISEMGVNPYKSEMDIPNSKNENELLDEIRFGKNSEVKAKVNKNNITEIEMTEVHPEGPPLTEINRKIRDNGLYAEVTTKSSGGKIQSATVRTRKRLR
ncbi:MAG: MerR family transcriptional regulator [Minisyncoccia bacterium]